MLKRDEKRTVHVSLNMTPGEAEQLAQLTARSRRTKSDVIRILISEARVDAGVKSVWVGRLPPPKTIQSTQKGDAP